MKIDSKSINDNSFSSISARVAVLIEEALHRERTVLYTTIIHTGDRFFGTIIWREKE